MGMVCSVETQWGSVSFPRDIKQQKYEALHIDPIIMQHFSQYIKPKVLSFNLYACYTLKRISWEIKNSLTHPLLYKPQSKR